MAALDNAAREKTTPEQALHQWMDALSGGATWARREPAAVRLAGWLDWTDAIALAAVLDGRGQGVVGDGAGHGAPTDPHAALEQGRTRLLAAVQATVREALQEWREVQARLEGVAADPAILRRAVTQSQRQLEAGVARLRAALRAQLATGCPAQRELAGIDAVLEQALVERQRHLLSGAAGRLSRLGENNDPSAIERGLMAALTAELGLRLQPLQGLAQALQPTESTHS